ncbi:SusD/RagB family nutrient-binding outer membrane lipoprotein [Prolixibacter sp. SD074]|jgi:hypothetical protein|uniref:SusD/RagB family nutrient-binding outer membrane lipoprotein n=1 Tax=Prolixibacter sp. SD074 TaxID=2652391 RepID=UPI001271CDC3|nr:SusD/RagB family nutrient-binding outer membrane lipoprotein [Prolixibacter sp. SD074]GET29989.1 hypothetical protein SD074_21910 [Prolixibacter sp. SD074]
MKNRYWLLLVVIALLASCTDKFEEYNTDTKNPSEVPGESLFSNAEKSLSDQISSTNVNLNIWKLVSQYWTETTYTDEANYNIVNRTIPDQIFRYYYRGFLMDLKRASELINAQTPVTDADKVVQQNKLYIIDLLEVYSYQRLVDIFGDVPYSEDLDITNISPKYDDAMTIYKDLISRVTADIAGLDNSEGSFGPADFYYRGDVASWKKFAYTLKVKLGITIADADETLAQSTVESAYANAFSSSSDDCLMPYLTNTPNTNTLYEDLVLSGRHDFVAANTVVDVMNGMSDPRLPLYFTQVNTSTVTGVEKLAYVGGVYGENSPFDNYSHVSDQLLQPTFPGILITYSELQFYLAEAAARGWNVGQTAEAYYNEGIKSSILWWGGTDAEANGYLANPSVNYTSAVTNTGNWKEVIGTQSWLASYTRGLVGYTTFRRLDYPAFNMPPTPPTGVASIPTRFTYPVNEQTLNEDNYKAAATAIGGDKLTTKIFWDIN